MTQGDARWDELSDEDFVADLVARHGVEAARAMAKTLALPMPKQGPKPWRKDRVGAKPVRRMALSRDLVKPQGVSWRELDSVVAWRDGYKGERNRSGLPKSGAPRPPKSAA